MISVVRSLSVYLINQLSNVRVMCSFKILLTRSLSKLSVTSNTAVVMHSVTFYTANICAYPMDSKPYYYICAILLRMQCAFEALLLDNIVLHMQCALDALDMTSSYDVTSAYYAL